MFGNELLHQPETSRILNDFDLHPPRPQQCLFAEERAVLADHDARNAVEEDRATAHGAGRQRRVQRARPVDRSRLPARPLERIHLAVQRRAALLDPPVVTAAENARLNNLVDRLQLLLGGPDAVSGAWPLVLANVLAAPLIEMAPVLVRRVGSRGRLILSGIPWSLESEVRQAYERLGMRYLRSEKRAGWIVLMLQASW